MAIKKINIDGKEDALISGKDIPIYVQRIEKQLQNSYFKIDILGVGYADEKFSCALNYMATSRDTLKQRIWGSYCDYLTRVLWSFDYKKYLTKASVEKWGFLQEELNYKAVSIPYGNELLLSSLAEYYRRDRNAWDYSKRVPLFFGRFRSRYEKIAQAIYYIAIELNEKVISKHYDKTTK